ncbi:hypothetical protein BMG00_16950 [Thioclava marina]|uniref:DUF924 domain-containing protein n=1 Tax=Thioclava marina TaxID=1915077 RepID=A0ABX3MJ53_9RHOB|nr:DUF924 family protein [Thioclava marina]OOY11402.1 hypothetical protein BMG00_16950 [Thioclava marina]
MDRIEEIVRFWRVEVGEKHWYQSTEEIDAAIRRRFAPLWQVASQGALNEWERCPTGALALILLLDQFPRNMFRDDPRAFQTDAAARDHAGRAIAEGCDMQIGPPLQQFFYLPFMHSEALADQDRAVQLFSERWYSPDNLKHARAHRSVIEQFGRFPWRNPALGRETLPEEETFLREGGYGKALNAQGELNAPVK